MRTLGILESLETQFQNARTRPPEPLLGWSAAPDRLTPIARTIAAAYHDDAARTAEPAYHNRHHITETVAAMAQLCGIAVRMGQISPDLAGLGILAMLGHDLGHDGSLAPPGILEAISAARVTALAAALPEPDRALLHALILSTAPHRVTANLAQARSANATPHDLLIALANEADVLASLLPELGWTLTALLAEEWHRHDPARATAARSVAGRCEFLRIYAEPTLPSRSIGLHIMIARQISDLGE